MLLETEIDAKTNTIEHIELHEEGVAVGRLAPVGKVRIGEQIVEAKSASGFVDDKTRVKVIEIHKTQIIIEPLN